MAAVPEGERQKTPATMLNKRIDFLPDIPAVKGDSIEVKKDRLHKTLLAARTKQVFGKLGRLWSMVPS